MTLVSIGDRHWPVTIKRVSRAKGTAMTPTDHIELSKSDFNAIAWRFLRSEFTDQIYADWPIDRRLDAYLLHHGPAELLVDGSAYDTLLDCVMANIGRALRTGVVPPRAPRNRT
jgi:hypothetical protein